MTRVLIQHIRKPTHHNSHGGVLEFHANPAISPQKGESQIPSFSRMLSMLTKQLASKLLDRSTKPRSSLNPNIHQTHYMKYYDNSLHSFINPPPLDEFDNVFALDAKLLARVGPLRA
jgi:hypothetical protein